jgi:cell division protein FtsB
MRPRTRLPRWARIALPIGVLALVAFLYWKPIHSYQSVHAQLTQRSAEVRALQSRNAALQAALASVDSGPTLLREARRLGFVLPGERLFIVKGIDAWRQSRHARIGSHG